MPGSTERPRGTTLLDRAGTARPASFSLGCRVYWAAGRCPGPFFRRLRGDRTAGLAPGLAPSPGRSWLRAAAGVPFSACLLACPDCNAPGARPLPVSVPPLPAVGCGVVPLRSRAVSWGFRAIGAGA
ncbi:hypothetical protein E1200_07520 [Actinomadura sp. GC306]|nr:hypothetical protein E1200_07520 [Actinomadura sp. GC306]